MVAKQIVSVKMWRDMERAVLRGNRNLAEALKENSRLSKRVNTLEAAARVALSEMRDTTASRPSFTDAVDALDDALAARDIVAG